MAVPDHDDVGAGPECGQFRRHVFLADRPVVVRGAAVHAAMDEHDGEVGVAPHRVEGARRRALDRGHPRAPVNLLAIPDHHARRGESRDADAHALPPHDAVGGEEEGIAGQIEDVAAHVGEAGVTDGAAEEWHAPVEVVVPGRRRVVPGEVHRLDDGVGLARSDPREVGRRKDRPAGGRPRRPGRPVRDTGPPSESVTVRPRARPPGAARSAR